MGRELESSLSRCHEYIATIKRSSWDNRDCKEEAGLRVGLVESIEGSRTLLKSPHITMGLDLKG